MEADVDVSSELLSLLPKPYISWHKNLMQKNVYSYTGSQHVETAEMDEEDQQTIKILETICFKGKQNMKRSPLITQFPIRKLYQLREELNISEIVENMFAKKYKLKNKTIRT